MNWTGGTLSRSRNVHSNAKVSLSVKQKNYFAKARLKLHHGQQPALPEIQYFDSGVWTPGNEVHEDQRPDRVKKGVSSQRTLDQFENVQGVVKKLNSIRPRTEERRRKRSFINDTEGYTLPSGIPIPPISPTTISSVPPSSSSPLQAEPATKRSIKRIRTSDPPMSDELYPLAALDSVEAKRRRLLQESDWVGVKKYKFSSKPVKMEFMSAKDRDLIGRRRSLNGRAVQDRWNVQGSRPMKIPLMAPCGQENEDWGPDGISIQIGSTATNNRPTSDEILDCDQSLEGVQRSSHPIQTPRYNEQESRYWARQITTPPRLTTESSEHLHRLFSPEDGPRLPKDYLSPELSPGFRLTFD